MGTHRSEIYKVVLRNNKNEDGTWINMHISVRSWVTLRPRQSGNHGVKRKRLNDVSSHWKAKVVGFVVSRGGNLVEEVLVAHAYTPHDMLKEEIAQTSEFPKLDANCICSSDFKDTVPAKSISSVLEVHHFGIGQLLFPSLSVSFLRNNGIWFHKYHYTKAAGTMGKLTLMDAPNLTLLSKTFDDIQMLTAYRYLLAKEIGRMLTERGGVRCGVKVFLPINVFAFLFKDVETLRIAPQTYILHDLGHQLLENIFFGDWRSKFYETGGQLTECSIDVSSLVFRYRIPKQTLYCNFYIQRKRRVRDNRNWSWKPVEDDRFDRHAGFNAGTLKFYRRLATIEAMGAGRHTHTVIFNTGELKSAAPQRCLPERDLAGVIFGCTKDTIQECIDKMLFGLPAGHWNYVQNIRFGLTLFLFNYDDKMLHGIFEAASEGGFALDPHAWTGGNKGRTRYPAQVYVRLRQGCQALHEKVFSQAIKQNYIDARKFMFELTSNQVSDLIALLQRSSARAPNPQPIAASLDSDGFMPSRKTSRGKKRGSASSSVSEGFSMIVEDGFSDAWGNGNGTAEEGKNGWNGMAPASNHVCESADGHENGWGSDITSHGHESVEKDHNEWHCGAETAEESDHSRRFEEDSYIMPQLEEDDTKAKIQLQGNSGALAQVEENGARTKDGWGNQSSHERIDNQIKQVSSRSSEIQESAQERNSRQIAEVNTNGSCWGDETRSFHNYVNESCSCEGGDEQSEIYAGQHAVAHNVLDGSEGRGKMKVDEDSFEPSENEIVLFEEEKKTGELPLEGWCQIQESIQKENNWQSTEVVRNDNWIDRWEDDTKSSYRHTDCVEANSKLEYCAASAHNFLDTEDGTEIKVVEGPFEPSENDVISFEDTTATERLSHEDAEQFDEILVKLRGIASKVPKTADTVLNISTTMIQLQEKAGNASASSSVGMDRSLRLCAAAICDIQDQHKQLKQVINEIKSGNIFKEVERLHHHNYELANVQIGMVGELRSLKAEVNEIKSQLAELWVKVPTCLSELYVIGGFNLMSRLSSVEVFSRDTREITFGKALLTARSCIAAASLHGQIFVLGGLDGATWDNSVEKYDPIGIQWSSCPPMEVRRGMLAAVTLHDRIYALGGRNGNTFHAEVEYFDPGLGSWLPSVSMLDRRHSFAAVELGNAIYVLGGSTDGTHHNTVEMYDQRESFWSQVPSMSCRRTGVSAAVLNGKIYALGGYDGQNYLSSVEVFEPRMRIWDKASNMLSKRAHGAAAVSGDAIYVVGGFSAPSAFVQSLDCLTSANGWESVVNSIENRCLLAASFV